MAISDLFSTSFLFSIAIIIILIGGIFAYVSYRMAEQDHKLTSMVNLVSILAQDLRFVKSKLVILEDTNTNNTNTLQYSSDIIGGKESSDLISVSDGEDDDEYTDDDENTDDDEDTEDDGNTSCEEDDDELLDEYNNSNEQIKILNLTLANENIDNDSPIEDLGDDFEPSDTPQSTDDIKTIHLETPITFEETEVTIPSEDANPLISSDDISFLTKGSFDMKNVTITDLGEAEDIHSSKSEYKKMSLNKLREVVVNKGVVSDASKLKKNDILKLLGDE
jgi:hypothetical protein